MSNWERTDNSAWDACTNFEFHNEFLMEDGLLLLQQCWVSYSKKVINY